VEEKGNIMRGCPWGGGGEEAGGEKQGDFEKSSQLLVQLGVNWLPGFPGGSFGVGDRGLLDLVGD
jgi:hypothetical protein